MIPTQFQITAKILDKGPFWEDLSYLDMSRISSQGKNAIDSVSNIIILSLNKRQLSTSDKKNFTT